MKNWIVLLLTLVVVACTSFPVETTVAEMDTASAPVIKTDPESGDQSTEISVLIYNIEGLPWPLDLSE